MIVIGGPLGGCDALREILAHLPADFRMPIAVVLHRQRESSDLLVPVVQRNCLLPVAEAEDKEPIKAGRVYLCPADYHLLIDNGCFALSTDEVVNFARPSIDVLFESAAEWQRQNVVAVILTGSGSDGARGARRVKEYGGTVFVHDPAVAEGPWMPTAAIEATKTPFVVTLAEITQALIGITAHRQHLQ
jgi:two-component system chemotaxis response regulator CheB